ncbi:MAG TPA: MFS transporter [Polyangiales bacterium]|nr:MFS transporter [Polyangiales bacterium]
MSTEARVSPYRWVVLFVFMLITMVIQLQWLAHAAVARPAAVFYDGQFDPSSFINIDFLAMVYMLVFLVMSFPASYVIDTYGIRTGISLGAGLAGVCGLTKGFFADDFQTVVVSQIGLAVAQPFVLNAVTAMSVRWFPLRERGTAAGLSALAQYLGILVAMLATPFLVGSDPSKPGYGTGFEGMLLAYGWLTFGAAVLTLLLLKDRPATPPEVETKEKQSFGKGILHILRLRDMQITLYLFLVGLGIFNAVSSMTDAIAASAGVQDSDGLIGGLMLVGGILGASILPVLSDKFRKRKPFLVACVVGMVPGILGLSFAGYLSADPGTVYAISLVSSFVLGFFIMSAGPLGFQYAAEVSHPAPESTSQGMLLWVGQITGMIFVAGMSIESKRYLPAFMLAFSILAIISAFVVSFLKESPMIITEQDRVADRPS